MGIFADDDNFIASNLLAGKTYFGLAGTLALGKKYATGTGTIASSQAVISGLTFQPRIVLVKTDAGPNWFVYNTTMNSALSFIVNNSASYASSVNASGFSIGLAVGLTGNFTWYAWE